MDPKPRLTSLDQFRGYTVVGMCVVNFLGKFAVTPEVLKHHNTYCSYADTIMPHFLFAVGFAFRLTFARRAHDQGLPSAYLRATRRFVTLAVLAIVLYTLGANWQRLAEQKPLDVLTTLAKRDWFQTLLHIAVTSLWILPVIRSGPAVRIGWMLASAAAHVALSWWFNFAWVNTPPNGIDGGPLGFLTWTIPAIVGTLACDAVTGAAPGRRTPALLAWGLLLMLLGYAVSCGTRLYDVSAKERSLNPPRRGNEPILAAAPVLPPWEWADDGDAEALLAEAPFVPPPDSAERHWNYWMMSQRSGSVSYLVFAAGLSLALYALFHLARDRFRLRLGVFRTLGTNALAAYVLCGLAEELIKPRIASDAPWPDIAAGLALDLGGTYLVVRLMEWRGWLLRL